MYSLRYTMAYFAPISNVVFVMFYLPFLNMLAGLVVGMVVDDGKFDFKKFIHCILETLCA